VYCLYQLFLHSYHKTETSQFCIKSTRAPTVYYLPKSIEKLTVLDKKEDTCFRKIRVEYKQGQSPLEDNTLTHITTFLEDATLQSAVRIYHGNERTHGKSGRGRGGRGRGRGRGQGGRYVARMPLLFSIFIKLTDTFLQGPG
jgi:hypothetical protein